VGEVWIGVTGFYATDNPNPGLAVARALRQADPSWRILALVYDRHATGAFAEDVIDAHAVVPYPGVGRRALLSDLATLTKGHALDVLIPTVDAEQAHYAALRGPAARLGIRLVVPTLHALAAREKRRLAALGRRAGVAVPPTTILPDADAVSRASARVAFPQILKGPLVDTAVVRSAEQFRVAGRELATLWGYPLIAQPILQGEEYDVAGVARRGELLATAVMKKLATTNKGTAWAGVTVDEPRCVEALKRLVTALRWDGAIEAEFIVQADGAIVCFEINPRFPSWIALAAAAGANLPEVLVRLALREPVDAGRARAGWMFARAVSERLFAGNPLGRLQGPRVRRRLLGERPLALSPAPRRRRPASRAVAVTGLNAADNPSPGLTVARALRVGLPDTRLVGLTHEVLASGGYVDGLWDELRLLPFPSREESGYGDALLEHCREAGVDCLLPTLDIEIPIVTSLADRLAAAGVATLLPPVTALQRASKPRLPALAAHGLRVPGTHRIGSYDDLARVLEDVRRPFVLKGPVADAKIVRTDEEAYVAAQRLLATWGFPLLAQERIEGDELGIAAVADRRHRVVGTVIVHKEIQTQNGNTWGGTTVVDRRLAALADRFAEAVGWVGPFELEVIRHPRRGAFLIEVNPRFPGWVYLSAGTGANLPAAAVQLAHGERVGRLRARPGVFYTRISWDMIAPVDRMGALAVEGKVSGHVV
jgi:carbamoyl-phosphate synthase large subunit